MMTRQMMFFVSLSVLLFLNLACSEDDVPTGVGNLPVTDPRLEPLQEEGSALAQTIFEVTPALAQGQLGNKEETDPWFDETCTCWRWAEFDGDYEDPLETWERNVNFAVTFFNGDVAQMEFEGADNIGMDINYFYYENHYDEEEYSGEKRYSSKSVNFNLTLQAAGFSEGAVAVTGSGSGDVSGGRTVGEEWEGFFEELEISVDLTIPFIGCPTGSFDLDMEEGTYFNMEYDGTSVAQWAYLAGEGNPLTGNFSIICNTE